MKEEETNIEKGNLKLTVFNSFPYEEMKKVCDAIVALGYKCEIVDSNIVFQKEEKQ